MPSRIEDYALIGDCETAALVGRDGSIDWLCWPRFDSPGCFAALLGDAEAGRWKIAPCDRAARVSRRYIGDTLVLETTFETPDACATMTDFMPPNGEVTDLVRIVRGVRGRMAFEMELVLRFDYGQIAPWINRDDEGTLRAVAGPDLVLLRTAAPFHGEGLRTRGVFEVAAGEIVPFVLTHGPSHKPAPEPIDPLEAQAATEAFWTHWSSSLQVDGPYAPLMRRSLLTLKALTYAPTGGIVAAPTTSLPEQAGGERTWDYRYCWIRDASLTLLALMNAGHFEEARAWTAWLQRAVAGAPADMQIMYGIAGERRLLEWRADWLPGYEGAAPVRIGNAAHTQFQLDIYGELLDAFYQARCGGVLGEETWDLERAVLDHVAAVWTDPDEGIWEVRSGRRHFTFSKVMAWVAADRAVKSAERFDLPGPVEAWRTLRARITQDVSERGVNRETGGFQRGYDDPHADASLLLFAELGFLRAEDPRFAATVAAVERELVTDDGLVLRYDSRRVDDGLPPGEGAFLPCSFWLANAYVLLGRRDEAVRLFETLTGFCNDLGLLAEEYDPQARRLMGNFPQAFSHVALLSTAMNLTQSAQPSRQRADGTGGDVTGAAKERSS